MKKQLIIFLLALLPMMASAQNERVFPLDFFTSLKIGNNTITFNNGQLQVNGSPVTAAPVDAVGQPLSGNTSPISSGGVYNSTQQTILRLSNRMDSISNALKTYTQKASADSAAAAISRAGINPNDLIANSVMNQWVDTKIAGTYFAPTAISFPAIAATSIQSSLAPVTGATSYQLWKSTTSATAGFSVLSTLTPSNLVYNDTGLTGSTNYWYRATATDGTHTSMPVTASATTLAVPSATYTTIFEKVFDDLSGQSSDNYATIVQDEGVNKLSLNGQNGKQNTSYIINGNYNIGDNLRLTLTLTRGTATDLDIYFYGNQYFDISITGTSQTITKDFVANSGPGTILYLEMPTGRQGNALIRSVKIEKKN